MTSQLAAVSRWRGAHIAGLCALGVTLCVLPLYAAVVPPMADLPAHVLVARIIAEYTNSIFRYSDYFTIDWAVAPTSLFYVLFVRLQQWVGPYWDARIYLTAWVALVWASVWYLAKVRGAGEPWIAALVSLPLAFSWYAYNGFLPFLMTLPLFAFTIAVWLNDWRPALKVPALWCLFAALYGFHIVGAAAAVAALGVAAAVQVFLLREDRKQLLWATLSVIPVGLMTLLYLGGRQGPRATIRYGDPLNQILDVIKFTCASLSDAASVLMLVWLGSLGLIAIWYRRHLLNARPAFAGAVVLAALSITMPGSLAALYPAGPRLLPFALVLLIASLRWGDMHRPSVVLVSVALLAGLSFFTTRQAMTVDRGYRDVLGAAEIVLPGKRVLPVIADQFAGSRWTKPFLHVEALVTIARGGSNPYVFAEPHVLTAASPIKFRTASDAREYAFAYDDDRDASDYKGVGAYYDYVLLWGKSPDIAEVVGREMTRVYARGNTTLFARREYASGSVPFGATRTSREDGPRVGGPQ
jgi:hypothetical protein